MCHLKSFRRTLVLFTDGTKTFFFFISLHLFPDRFFCLIFCLLLMNWDRQREKKRFVSFLHFLWKFNWEKIQGKKKKSISLNLIKKEIFLFKRGLLGRIIAY